jgi:hypothetical protein
MMEMEQMLAKMGSFQEEIRTNQEKVAAIHKEVMTQTDDNQKGMEADRKTDREKIKQEVRAGQEHMQEMIRTSQEKLEAAI